MKSLSIQCFFVKSNSNPASFSSTDVTVRKDIPYLMFLLKGWVQTIFTWSHFCVAADLLNFSAVTTRCGYKLLPHSELKSYWLCSGSVSFRCEFSEVSRKHWPKAERPWANRYLKYVGTVLLTTPVNNLTLLEFFSLRASNGSWNELEGSNPTKPSLPATRPLRPTRTSTKADPKLPIWTELIWKEWGFSTISCLKSGLLDWYLHWCPGLKDDTCLAFTCRSTSPLLAWPWVPDQMFRLKARGVFTAEGNNVVEPYIWHPSQSKQTFTRPPAGVLEIWNTT